MLLSIVTVNYNNKDGLRKTIDSIVNQTFNDYEWIVIDGGSSDGGKELIEEYQNHFSYWVSEQDNGVYHAMNKALLHVNGEYVNFMNSGDVFYKENTLEELFNHQLKGDLIYGDWIEEVGTNKFFRPSPKGANLDYFFTANICHQSAFIKSSIIKKYGFNENYKIVADWEIWIKMLIDGFSMQYIPQTICIFDGNDGISSKKDNKLMKERNFMIDNTIPPCYIAVLRENYRMRNILKDLDNSQLSAKDLNFIRWHPRFAKLINLFIRLSTCIKEAFK